MTQESDSHRENGAIDERIRQLGGGPDDMEYPTSITARVLVKTRRRRLIFRTGYAMTTVLFLVSAGVSLLHWLEVNQTRRQVVDKDLSDPQGQLLLQDRTIVELDPEYLSSPPPVFSLDLISEDQIALFHCLDALEEELQ